MTHNSESNDGKTTQISDSDVVELSLLLPRWQALALESAAEECGLTTAQLLRRMIRENLSHQQLTE